MRTGRNTARGPEFTRMLLQILCEPLAELLGNVVFPGEVGGDLGARSGESVLASATYQGLAVAIYMQIAAGQDDWGTVTIHDDGNGNTAGRQEESASENYETAGRRLQRGEKRGARHKAWLLWWCRQGDGRVHGRFSEI